MVAGASLPDSEVVVVGAGAAGLAAAVDLAHAGLSVRIVEARDRVGGRIHTIRDTASTRASIPLELGAEFVHGCPTETWDIARDGGAPLYEVADEHWETDGTRLRRVEDFWQRLDRVFSKMPGASATDLSFDEFARRFTNSSQRQAARQLLPLARAYVEGFNAADASRISVQSLVESQRAEERIQGHRLFRFSDGYDSLMRRLREQWTPGRVVVHLSTIAQTIRWSADDGVEIEAVKSNGGEPVPRLKAPMAIITLPLGVMQMRPKETGAVRFIPELDMKRNAAGKLVMGNVVKAVLRFQSAFWEVERPPALPRDLDPLNLSFLHSTDASGISFPTWWSLRPLHAPVLVGWTGGPAADRLSGRGEREIADEAIRSLARFLGFNVEDLRRRVLHAHVADWRSDPFSRGAYSYVAVGGTDAMRKLAEPVASTLFFAGEATHHEGLNATVAGAIASGRRAAREVLSARHALS